MHLRYKEVNTFFVKGSGTWSHRTSWTKVIRISSVLLSDTSFSISTVTLRQILHIVSFGLPSTISQRKKQEKSETYSTMGFVSYFNYNNCNISQISELRDKPSKALFKVPKKVNVRMIVAKSFMTGDCREG